MTPRSLHRQRNDHSRAGQLVGRCDRILADGRQASGRQFLSVVRQMLYYPTTTRRVLVATGTRHLITIARNVAPSLVAEQLRVPCGLRRRMPSLILPMAQGVRREILRGRRVTLFSDSRKHFERQFSNAASFFHLERLSSVPVAMTNRDTSERPKSWKPQPTRTAP